MATLNIHCTLGLIFFLFRNLQSLMRPSKLQKHNPSAIDKRTMVFVPVKKEEIEVFC
jgi:hypothetical protein